MQSYRVINGTLYSRSKRYCLNKNKQFRKVIYKCNFQNTYFIFTHGPGTPVLLGWGPAAPEGAAGCEQGNESDGPWMLISAAPAGREGRLHLLHVRGTTATFLGAFTH